jgi:hypothetical protein
MTPRSFPDFRGLYIQILKECGYRCRPAQDRTSPALRLPPKKEKDIPDKIDAILNNLRDLIDARDLPARNEEYRVRKLCSENTRFPVFLPGGPPASTKRLTHKDLATFRHRQNDNLDTV